MSGEPGKRSERERLRRALALSRRFHLYLVTCPSPRAADALVAWLQRELPNARGEDLRWVRLDPHRGRRTLSALGREEITTRVLEPLMRVPPELRQPNVIHIVDASRAQEADDEAWLWFCQRWNEQRNAVQQRLGGQLLVLLPPRLETLFARGAPDVWSTRSGEYRVDEETAAPAKAPTSLEDRPTQNHERTPNRVAKIELPEAPNGMSFAELQEDLLERLAQGRTAIHAARFHEARHTLRLAVGVARTLRLQASPSDRPGSERMLARALEAYARAEIEFGALDAARQHLEEGLELVGKGEGTADVEALHTRLDMTRLAGDVCVALGDLRTAWLRHLDELATASRGVHRELPRANQRMAALEVRQKHFGAARTHSQAAETLLAQSTSLLSQEERHDVAAAILETKSDAWANDDWSKSASFIEQAIRHRRAASGPGSPARLAAALARSARLQLQRGDADRAEGLVAEALHLWADEATSYLELREALRLLDDISVYPPLEPDREALRARIERRESESGVA